MRARSCIKLIALGLLLAGCRDGDPLSPLRDFLGLPNAAISHAGESHFFWLPPLVQGEPTPTGTFNPDLRPTVTICAVSDPSVAGRAACGDILKEFASSEVQVSTTDEHYRVNWDTETNAGSPGTYYRLLVRVSGFDLGYADVYVATSAKDLKNVVDSSTLGLVDGRTLPIKFRIEHGAVTYAAGGGSCDNCTEKTVSNTTEATAVVPSGSMGVHVPQGAIPASYGDVTVVVEEKQTSPTEPCFTVTGFNGQQVPGCLEANTYPYIPEGFGVPVTVTVCMDRDIYNNTALRDQYSMYQYSPERASLTRPEEVAGYIAGVDCSNYFAMEATASPMKHLAMMGLRKLQRAVLPSPAWAADFESAQTNNFSYFTWGRVLTSQKSGAVDNATFAAGATVQPEILVTVDHHGTPKPVAGETVTFGPPSHGTLSQSTAVTDSDGIAKISWTLGTSSSQTLVATGPDGSSHTFTVTVPTTTATTTTLSSSAPFTDAADTVTLTATVSPAPADGSTVEFYTGTNLLGTATTTGGVATFVPQLSFNSHQLTARFAGTGGMDASTSAVVAQHFVRRYTDLNSFSTALGNASTETQNFNQYSVGTPISTIVADVLDVSSPFATLEVWSDHSLFGHDGTTRTAGDGRYVLTFRALRNALAFDIGSQNPNTGAAEVRIETSAGTYSYFLTNPNSESTPNFVGLLSTVMLNVVTLEEGAEVGGSGSEEVSLDNFVIASKGLP